MSDDKPHLTLVDQNYGGNDQEFIPLPMYPWDERPETLPIESDEAATALHIAHGDEHHAAELLKVPTIRLKRLVRNSPRLQRVREESLGVALARAESIPLRTLFDPQADARRLEWASTKILQSRLAIGSPLSPAPPATVQSASLTVNSETRTLKFRWRTDEDDDDGG